jgi:hypothetical protein
VNEEAMTRVGSQRHRKKKLHVKYGLYSSALKELDFLRQIFEKYSNIKFHKNPSSGS